MWNFNIRCWIVQYHLEYSVLWGFFRLLLLFGQSGFCTPIHIYSELCNDLKEKCFLFFNDSSSRLPLLLLLLVFVTQRFATHSMRGFSFLLSLKLSLKEIFIYFSPFFPLALCIFLALFSLLLRRQLHVRAKH